jgi:Fur family ferric uptake transcriptional regulator
MKSDAVSAEAAVAALKAAGLRLTRPRRAILAALARSCEPVRIERLHSGLSSVKCDLVTVYRCVAAFEEAGLVRRVFSLDGTGLYELSVERPPRYRLVCRRTGKREPLDPETSAELSRALKAVEERLAARGYSEVGHLAEFFGVPPPAQLPRARLHADAGIEPEQQEIA